MSALVLGLLLPLLITVLFQNRQLDILLGGVETAAGQDADCVPEEVLIGMLAKEISVNAEEEVLRAQCVIARTNYLDAKQKGAKEPDRMSLQEMQDNFGEAYDAVYETFRQCVKTRRGKCCSGRAIISTRRIMPSAVERQERCRNYMDRYRCPI